MLLDLLGLILSLVVILFCCELFTNSIEWLGKKMKVGEGVVGSLFSAVGTCLPETIIPIIALIFSKATIESESIGIGAIIGAPFMLSTLAFFLTGLSVLIFWRRRKTRLVLKVNCKILSRDIGFFIVVYSFGILSSFITLQPLKYLIAGALLFCYAYYVVITVKQDVAVHTELEPLFIIRFTKFSPELPMITLQIVISLLGIILGAELFIRMTANTSGFIGISPLALSLLITPVATELPEKFNSISWIRKKKDTLALGNITGAMVFQSCIPVSVGIFATTWQLDIKALVSACLAIMSALFTFFWIKIKGKLSAVPLLFGGLFYAAFIVFLILRGFK